ncbi:MAG: D-tyrosyl-tRNA(Tyr) deacylase [Gammaproteobacteria bacterium RIFCSPLOWO2_02_FULL_57_10]|nr:MAG: D-tyrosyl-tRNA(Tyr) deacylase [Gammaproteobacteria bacterium RIFCSPLOWO2_02_FULL_57_10]
MIALLQRTNWARLTIDGQQRCEIGKGLVVFVGIEKDDDENKADRLLHRLRSYRVFADAEGKMNLSLLDIAGDILLVSQFTLAATTDKGLRPGFSSAMPPAQAEPLYDYMVRQASTHKITLATGVFGADMKVALENDGPVTFLLKV